MRAVFEWVCYLLLILAFIGGLVSYVGFLFGYGNPWKNREAIDSLTQRLQALEEVQAQEARQARPCEGPGVGEGQEGMPGEGRLSLPKVR